MPAGAVVLAAGRGRRLGGVAKALLRCPDGHTFLESVARIARRVGVERLVVVSGPPHRPDTEAEAGRLGLEVTRNPAPDRGMASSVARGFGHAVDRWPDAEAALLWPVDHPYVAVDTVAALLRRSSPDRIVVPSWRGRGGHPALFGRALWSELAGCTDAPEGARSVVRAHDEAVERIDVSDAAVVADVDTQADLR